MELYKEILANVLSKQAIRIDFPGLKLVAEDIVEMECYKALLKIKRIIEDHSLEDEDCFAAIEEIVCVFEEIGSNGGARHDFG